MEPLIIPRADHPISRKDIDPDVLRVLYKLKDAGFDTYLVGGAVRDLMLGRHPKDFDVATNARPHELRKLFRNSRIVGRRFRLVHVFFGAKNVEVATLRSMVEPSAGATDLYIEEDNEWGDLESDSFRRDFTINALYYDMRDFAVVDYVGGVKDLHDHLIRCIGDPQVRFREDPVRMLRAIKFAARFGCAIEPETDAGLRQLQSEILKSSRFRVTEEIFRILIQPNRQVGLRMLKDYGFFRVLYPQWLEAIGDEGFEQVWEFFDRAEAAAADDRFFPMEVLCTGLFIPLLDSVDIEVDSFHRVAARVTHEVAMIARQMDLPKRLTAAAVDLLRGQLYLLFFHHRPKRVKRYVAYPGFDLVWRVHELAFGGIAELQPIQDIWAEAREQLRRPLGGVVEAPDRRDIFSFRGKTGGGRVARHGGRGAAAEVVAEDGDWVPFVDEDEG